MLCLSKLSCKLAVAGQHDLDICIDSIASVCKESEYDAGTIDGTHICTV